MRVQHIGTLPYPSDINLELLVLWRKITTATFLIFKKDGKTRALGFHGDSMLRFGRRWCIGGGSWHLRSHPKASGGWLGQRMGRRDLLL